MDCIFYGATDIGCCRENNEDAFLLKQNGRYVTSLVVDGTGSNFGGKMASYLACKCISEYLEDTSIGDIGIDTLKQAVIYANNAIVSQQQINPQLYNMSCVLTAVIFDLEEKVLHMCHVGDTRLYQYRDGKLIKLSLDHSPVGEQEDAGLLSEEEAMHHPRRNIITKYIGSRLLEWGTDYVLTKSFPIQIGSYLMSSDGLHGVIPAVDIANVLSQKITPHEKVETLITLVNKAKGRDNITVNIINIKE